MDDSIGAGAAAFNPEIEGAASIDTIEDTSLILRVVKITKVYLTFSKCCFCVI